MSSGRLLTDAEYSSTMGDGMRLLQPHEIARPVDVGSYLASVAVDDLRGHDLSPRHVTAVYGDRSGRWMHVLLGSDAASVFLVVVVDQAGGSVYGHHLLDLDTEYGRDGHAH